MSFFTKKQKRTGRKILFTEELVKILKKDENSPRQFSYTDAGCKCLQLLVSDTDSSYIFMNGKVSKVIGNVYNVPLKKARAIVNNIRDNYKEFYQNIPPRCSSLSVDFRKNGFFPRKKVEEANGTATILSDENASLKEKIKELEAEIESLRDINIRLGSRLQTIRKLACYDEADVEIDD